MSPDSFVVASGLTPAVRDTTQLLPMVAAVAAPTGERPQMGIADNGDLPEENLAPLRAQGQRCLLGIGREGKAPGRWSHGAETQRMHRLLRLPWARRVYARRKTQAERPNAEMKRAMRCRRFMLRGTAKVRGEWALVCAAFNLRRLRALAVAGG